MASRSAYKGPRRKLVLAFDVGTTYSGISYSVLDPGRVPEIKGVTRFPAHEHVNGASKIPTIVYYDRSGKVRAVGAEAASEVIYAQAEEEQWVKAEWFKLHLRSTVIPGAGREVGDGIPPLPLNKTVVEVFADFLAYLFECASSYIQEAHANGVDLWASLKGQIDFVLSHPNGWEGAQQSEMRKAAVLAKLIPDTPAGHARLSFVTEGEASLHFAIQNGLPDGAMKNGDGVVIVDAGGGTIDISSYSRNISASKETFEEVAPPQCHFHGSVFVNLYAQKFLEKYLADSPFADDVDHIVRCFDKTTKMWFKNAEDAQYIKFGSTRDNDAGHNIRFGQLKLLGPDIASFFKPSIDCIIKTAIDQKNTALKPISHVVLVGGFAASNYMFNTVHAALSSAGLKVLRPENHVNKAVSNGSVSFYLDRFVRSRIAKITYGVTCDIGYDPSKADHRQRLATSYFATSGHVRIRDAFDVILPKNTQVQETKEFRRPYVNEADSVDDLMNITMVISCYRGSVAQPKWKDVDKNNYTTLCSIDVNVSVLPRVRLPKYGAQEGGFYYQANFDIVLLFGLTELKAQVAWKEGGIEKRYALSVGIGCLFRMFLD
ncbi:hypothetical protein BJ912DRAFT_1145353 [Pholiota molesta]|nr:hypothetical protein BJ912DRAFT_1145353 [Pholiota molesta]